MKTSTHFGERALEEFLKVQGFLMKITVPFAEIMEQWGDVSVSKLVGVVQQGLFDRPVSCQHQHFLGPQVDCEHRPIRFGQLGGQRRHLTTEKATNI